MTFPGIDSISTYGGLMSDYAPVEDPTTDLAAASFNKMSASAAAMTHVSNRAWCSFTGGSSPAIVSHDSAWGSDVSVKPTIAKIGTGHHRITWPVTITDGVGTSQSINLRASHCNVQGSTLYFVQCTPYSAYQVDVYVFNASAAANDGTGVTFDVFAL